MTNKNRLIVGVSGASGAIYGVRLLEMLKPLDIEVHLVISKAAHITLKDEVGISVTQIKGLADHVHAVDDIAAAISSGSFVTMGMIIAPCSVKTLSEIAHGITSNLMSRAADVVLKERRRLVLMLRETPFNINHIDAMRKVTEMGGIIAPPVPAFYTCPQTIDDIVNHSVGRVLDLFSLHVPELKRWKS